MAISYYNKLNSYIPKGVKNKTILPEFVNICKMSQKKLIDFLIEKLIESGYCNIIKENGYIYAKGDIPVLLTAHMDTVHTEKIKDFYEYIDKGCHILSSPQGIGGDDRCGIYMILEIIKTHKCSVLFCEDEEKGGIGSKEFCKTEFINEVATLNYMIELDRANSDDAVFYDCDNKEFTNFIIDNTGYNESYGTFSDISYLAPAAGIAAVNLSCGYYHAHTLSEEVNIEEMLNNIEVVKNLLDVESDQFEYIECEHLYNYYNRYNNYYDNTYSNCYTDTIKLYVLLSDGNYIVTEGSTIDNIWKNFFFNNPMICYNDVVEFGYYY